MPKDYKHRVPGTLKRSRRRRHQWLWALPAILVGVAAIAVFKFTGSKDPAPDPTSVTEGGDSSRKSREPTAPTDSKTGAAGKDRKQTRGSTQKNKSGPAETVPEVNLPEPRFTFYKILPEKEVIVSESEIRNLARDEKAGKGEPSASYLIQAGSFAKKEEAEKMKAHLAEAKVKARMEAVIIENTTWYRVKIGPYKSLTEAEQMRAYLRKNKIDSVLQQTKPDR